MSGSIIGAGDTVVEDKENPQEFEEEGSHRKQAACVGPWVLLQEMADWLVST